MSNLKIFSIAIGRMILGIIVLVMGLIIFDIIIYLSATGSTVTERAMAAYQGGYDEAYTQTYGTGYQNAYNEAYKKGYEKGYEIGLGLSSKEATATRVELHNPTYDELREFLASDNTDSNQFVSNEYVCFDFATELNNNAEANGIRAGYAWVRFEDWGHALVAFETVDRGLIFIEPQSDRQVREMVIGKPYPWYSSGATTSRNYADVIIEVQVIW